MPNQVISSVENNFTKGLVTEFTGMNFPENAATDTDNTEYTIVGDVLRRQGIDLEVNGTVLTASKVGRAVSAYKWNDAGGNGNAQVVVEQIGENLYFFLSSSATVASPLSTQRIGTVPLVTYVALSSSLDASLECQYADGNGYLFVFHPSCDPFYVTFNPSNNSVAGNVITVQIRDLVGFTEPNGNSRLAGQTPEHFYNLQNQGWVKGSPWSASSSTQVNCSTGLKVFSVQGGLTVSAGDTVNFTNSVAAFPGGTFQPIGSLIMSGTVTGYATTFLSVNITAVNALWLNDPYGNWTIVPTSNGYLNTFVTVTGTYPSNADVWWYFKNSSGVFDPATTIGNVTLSSGSAPKGHYILNAFTQTKSLVSSIVNINDIVTTVRPRTGAWFQGRVWYTGVDAQQSALGDEPYYSWTGNIYFSQTVKSTNDFGLCYQLNDPTSDRLFGLLPSDGGVISIPESGSIYKLFPLQNALLIFAANGVWYLTGSSGIGFTANDYTIVKLSSVRSISSSSFVDVQGLPLFWNEEGIYQVEPAKQGTQLLNSPLHVNPLEVSPITLGTILSFYNNIPLSSKKYAHGAYDPIEYVVKWVYRDTESPDFTGNYAYNKILNYNVANKAFFPYTVNSTVGAISGLVYVSSPGGGQSAVPADIKYIASVNNNAIYFADEHDTTYVDWASQGGFNFVSSFTCGYKVHGQGEKRFQIPYIYVYSRLQTNVAYYIQSMWDYATSGASGRWSTQQQVTIPANNFSNVFKRHRLRGMGLVLQIKITSVDGQPFDIIAWAINETMNTGV